jgi:putative nucleotidyltransferase with HDIG domain
VNRPSIISIDAAAKTAGGVGCSPTPALDALIERACSNDRGFREHSENVAAISVHVGRELRLGDRDLELLELAAAVHDVGKLCVPATILAKAGPLDQEEWAAMRAHPAAGAVLLEPCEAPPEVLEIVRSHHERWDGAGYPDGLRGERIPLGARIIAVADAYCAMIESRPYRPPRRPAAARAELLAQAGRQFDSVCAQATYRVTAPTG